MHVTKQQRKKMIDLLIDWESEQHEELGTEYLCIHELLLYGWTGYNDMTNEEIFNEFNMARCLEDLDDDDEEDNEWLELYNEIVASNEIDKILDNQ